MTPGGKKFDLTLLFNEGCKEAEIIQDKPLV